MTQPTRSELSELDPPIFGARLSPEEATEFQSCAGRIADAVNGFMQGKADVVRLALLCLLAEGHLLLEDVPGVGKTSLARCFAGALGLPWQRIQFTPDLLPSDVTGISVFHQDANNFVFHKGPIFANFVLADEVNRASPRTQSALLEVMEERTVTVDGTGHPVPRPFMVMATQNPVEMDGTYPLPEAQIDRFLIKTAVGYPDRAAEARMLTAAHRGAGIDEVARVSSPEEVHRLVAAARTVHLAPSVVDYIVAIVACTREVPTLRLGSSPRGAIGLMRAGRVAAALDGRSFVVPSDIQALARPVLAHRILVASSHATGLAAEEVIDDVIASVEAPPVDGVR